MTRAILFPSAGATKKRGADGRTKLNIHSLGRRWRLHVTVTGVLLVALLGWADHVSGSDKSFLIFYSLLVAVIGWRAGRGPMITVAVSSTVAWAAAIAASPDAEPALLLAWNALNRLAVFLSIGLLTHLLTRESQLARQDALTGLDNLRSLREYLARRRRSNDLPLAVVSMDVDDFKGVNDRLGHAVGDELLANIGGILRSSVRTDEIAARVGGDEFIVLLRAVTRAQVESIVTRVLERIKAIRIGTTCEGVHVSVGIAYVESELDRIESFLVEADRALYAAKADKTRR